MILTLTFYFIVSIFLYLIFSRPAPDSHKKYSRSTILSQSHNTQVPSDWTPISHFTKTTQKRVVKPRPKPIPQDDKENIPANLQSKPSLSSFILTELESSLSELKKPNKILNPNAQEFVLRII